VRRIVFPLKAEDAPDRSPRHYISGEYHRLGEHIYLSRQQWNDSSYPGWLVQPWGSSLLCDVGLSGGRLPFIGQTRGGSDLSTSAVAGRILLLCGEVQNTTSPPTQPALGGRSCDRVRPAAPVVESMSGGLLRGAHAVAVLARDGAFSQILLSKQQIWASTALNE